jgi:quercetin dioxygenase-like cupin family protein
VAGPARSHLTDDLTSALRHGRVERSTAPTATVAGLTTRAAPRRDPMTSSPSQPHPADGLASTLERTELQRSGSSIAGRDIVQVLTEIPEGVESGWHTHPGEEVGYILAGTVQMQIEDRPTLVLEAGQGFLIPPRTPHNALDLGPGTGRMLSTYIVAADEPIATLLDR